MKQKRGGERETHTDRQTDETIFSNCGARHKNMKTTLWKGVRKYIFI